MILYCKFCNDYLGVVDGLSCYYCEDCQMLRRIMLINDRKEFLSHIRNEFIKFKENFKKDKEVRKEIKKTSG